MRVPGDRVLYPPAAARWLLGRAVGRGAELRQGSAVLELLPRRVRTAAGTLEAGAVVLAAGLGSAGLVPGLPLQPRRGHLLVTDRAPGFARHQLVELGYLRSAHGPSAESVAFNLQPRATGQLLLGSSRELGVTDVAPNPRLRDRMIRRALEFVPGLARLPVVRGWTGLRPATPDNLPYLGAWEPLEGLVLATGHEGLGITTAPGSAELVADLLAGRRGALDPVPYSPMRNGVAAHG
jgi:glycine/D-amino acid oxidase-like deaminating enzyme